MNLDAVRDALVADAQRDVAALRAAAEQDALAAVATAGREAQRLLAMARAEGEAEARRAVAIERARARRRAREEVLAARLAAYDRLRATARAAALELRHDPRYPMLLDQLSRAARAELGDDAEVLVDDDAGGVVARAGSRSVDYRLGVLVDRAVRAMGPRIEALWR